MFKHNFLLKLMKSILIVILFTAVTACIDSDVGENLEPPGSMEENTVTSINIPLINSISPDFGTPGDRITLNIENANHSVSIKIRGVSIPPDSISGDAETITFVIPDGAISGPLKVTSTGKSSNSVWFPITESGIIAPDENEIIIDEFGNKVAIGYLLVSLFEENDTREEADRLAALVSGEVIGRISMINGWQIKVDPGSLAGLEAIATFLEMDPSVEFTVIDIEVKPDAILDTIDWSKDPDRALQRDRNRVEQGAALYASKVSPTQDGKIRPIFMSIGVSELGVDFTHPDFSGYSKKGNSMSGSVSIYATKGGEHGSNVTGIIAAELGDKGNAGIIRALSGSHGGANISVGVKVNFWKLDRIAKTQQQLEAGSQVINWSWGVHREGMDNCAGRDLASNLINEDRFTDTSKALTKFFKILEKQYPNAVIVSSAGNGATDAGDIFNRLPSSIVSDQLIVVGSHTTKGTIARKSKGGEIVVVVEDEYAKSTSSTSCFDTTITTGIKRASYSNYGSRVDIAASGSIMGINDDPHADAKIYVDGADHIVYSNRGTSYAVPLVTATVALMQSINPHLTPANIKSLIRKSALPIENKVVVTHRDSSQTYEVFTRPLSIIESASHSGKGARLNVEGAIQKALDSLGESTLPLADPITVFIDSSLFDVTKTIPITIPSDGALFDKVDIMFLVDVSGSYRDDLSVFKNKANELINSFSAFGANVNIGLSSFSDFPVSPFGTPNDYAYQLDQALTDAHDSVINAINNLTLLNGGDNPESQLEAMFQASHVKSGWRSGALPILFLATDASFHNSDDNPDYPGTGYNDALTALNDAKIRVFGLQSGGSVADVIQIAEATGGQVFELSRDSAEIITAVETAMDETIKDISVQMETNGDFKGFVKSITPASVEGAKPGDAITNVNPGDTIEFDVVFSKGIFDDDSTHTFSFRLRVVAEDIAVIKEIPVTIKLN